MLILKRAKKTEALVQLLQSYFQDLAETQGFFEQKEDISVYHSLLDSALFNVACGYIEPENVLNIAALLELAKQKLGTSEVNGQSQAYPFLWLVHQGSKNLKKYLGNQGFFERGVAHALCYDVVAHQKSFESHPAIEFNPVQSLEEFYEYCNTFAECHGLSEGMVEKYFQSGFGPNRKFDLYLAQLYNKTVGCCAMYHDGDSVVFLWDAVLPMYRRQGVGSVMALNRLKLAKDIGVKSVYVMATESLYMVYKRLGFLPFAKFDIMRFDPRLPSTLQED